MSFLRNLFKKRETELRIIDVDVLLDIEEHQNLTPEREIVGRIIVRHKVGVSYEPFVNWSRNWDGFKVGNTNIDLDHDLAEGEFGILVHSHPEDPDHPKRCKVTPSSVDLAEANRKWLNRPYGIFHPTSGQLFIYILHRNRKTYSRQGYKIALGPKAFAKAMEEMSKPKFPRLRPMPPLDKSL